MNHLGRNDDLLQSVELIHESVFLAPAQPEGERIVERETTKTGAPVRRPLDRCFGAICLILL